LSVVNKEGGMVVWKDKANRYGTSGKSKHWDLFW